MTEELKKTSWWKKTDSNVQQEILEISTGSSLFTNFLLNIPAEDTDFKLVSIQKIVRAEEMAIVKLLVETKSNNQLLSKEFSFSLKETVVRGRCLIVLNTHDKKKYIVLNQIRRPWLNKTNLGSFTSFFPSFSKNSISDLPSKVKKSIDDICKGNKWQISQVTDLGSVNLDTETSGNQIPIFLLEITTETKDIQVGNHEGMIVFGGDEEGEIIKKCSDVVTLSILAKMTLIKI